MLYMPISLSFLKKETTCIFFCSIVNGITGIGHAKAIFLILSNIYIYLSNAYHSVFQLASKLNMQITWVIIFSNVNKSTLKILKTDGYGAVNILKW